MGHDDHSSLAPEEVNEELEEGVYRKCLNQTCMSTP